MVPGSGSPLETLLIEKAGFSAAYISGYCVAAQRYGVPDIGLVGLREIQETLQSVREVTSLPLIVDCDTGYGGVTNVRQTVRVIEGSGADAIQIEDQVWPKRCGHLFNKTLEPLHVAAKKIEAAVLARGNDDLLVIGRTDSRSVLGFEDAIIRAKAFKEAGADLVLMHSPQSPAELREFAAEISGPHIVLVGEGDIVDAVELSDLQDWGYRLAIYPSSLLRTAAAASRSMLAMLQKTGRIGASPFFSLDELNQVVDLDKYLEFEHSLDQNLEDQAPGS